MPFVAVEHTSEWALILDICPFRPDGTGTTLTPELH